MQNDEDIRIIDLPEVDTLSPGMMVAVDSESTGSKSFDLGQTVTDLGQTVTDIEGSVSNLDTRVVTIEGNVSNLDTRVVTIEDTSTIYMLKYSEVNDFTDIDLTKATTKPTYINIDSAQTIPMHGNTSSITVESGTMLRLIEIKSNAWATFTTEQVNSYPGAPNNSGFGSTCHVDVMLKICRTEVSETTKVWAVAGDIPDGNNLFDSGSGPCTYYYSNGRGSYTDNNDGKATALQITHANGKYRRNLLMPEEIQTHDFANDTAPQTLQVMAWSSLSNRAGYTELITAKSNMDDDHIPLQTPTVSITKMNIGNPASLEADQVVPLITTSVKDTSGTSSTIDGYLIPRIPTIQGEKVYLQYYWEGQKGHLDWAKIDAKSDLVLVTGETGEEKATNCQAIIDAGKLPIYNAAWRDNGVPYNQVLVYQCSDDNYFYFMGCYPTYFVNGTFKFRADTNDVQIGLWYFSKTSFSNGYTVRTIDDLLVNSAPISSTTASATIPNNRLTIISSSYTNNQSTYTVQINSIGQATNAAFEIKPNVNMTLTVERQSLSGTTTLRYSVAAGNQLEAGKYYQVTAVGNCWTLAEFQSPS